MAKIIKLDDSRRPAPKQTERGKVCEHKEVVAYTAYRTVHCAICGTELDPFAVLVDLLKGYVPPGSGDRELRQFDREADRRQPEKPESEE
jgi:hypothetical protein